MSASCSWGKSDSPTLIHYSFIILYGLACPSTRELTRRFSRPNVAPPVEPGIGGILAARLGWGWIFWFFGIAGGACLVLSLFTLPETARGLVGNGSILPPRINRTLLSLLRRPSYPPESKADRSKMSAESAHFTEATAARGRMHCAAQQRHILHDILLCSSLFGLSVCRGLRLYRTGS